MTTTRPWQDNDRVWLDGAMWRRYDQWWQSDDEYDGAELRPDEQMTGAVLVATVSGPVEVRS